MRWGKRSRGLGVGGRRVVLSGPPRRLRVARSATCRRRPGGDTASERQDVSCVAALDVSARRGGGLVAAGGGRGRRAQRAARPPVAAALARRRPRARRSPLGTGGPTP